MPLSFRCFFFIYHAAVSGHGLALLGRLIVNAHVARRGCALHLEAQSLTRGTMGVTLTTSLFFFPISIMFTTHKDTALKSLKTKSLQSLHWTTPHPRLQNRRPKKKHPTRRRLPLPVLLIMKVWMKRKLQKRKRSDEKREKVGLLLRAAQHTRAQMRTYTALAHVGLCALVVEKHAMLACACIVIFSTVIMLVSFFFFPIAKMFPFYYLPSTLLIACIKMALHYITFLPHC